MAEVPVLAGVGVAAGVLLVLAGFIGIPVALPIFRSAHSSLARRIVAARRMSIAVGIASGAAVVCLTGWPVAGAATAIGVVAVPPMLRTRTATDRIALREALAEWAQRLATALASGTGGIESAIARSAKTAPQPLREHVATLTERAHSRGLEPALRAFADDLGEFSADALVASLILRVRDGGSGLVAVLDGWAASLRQEVRAQRAVEADRAKPRAQIRIVFVIVGAVVAVLLTFSHRFLAPYDTPAGQVWLAVVVAVWFAALWLAFHLTRSPRRRRFLAEPRFSRPRAEL